MTDTTRPDWMHCVGHDHAELKGKSWCGKDIPMQFHFVDIDHAAENGRQKGYLVACPKCVAAITAALRNGHEEMSGTPHVE